MLEEVEVGSVESKSAKLGEVADEGKREESSIMSNSSRGGRMSVRGSI